MGNLAIKYAAGAGVQSSPFKLQTVTRYLSKTSSAIALGLLASIGIGTGLHHASESNPNLLAQSFNFMPQEAEADTYSQSGYSCYIQSSYGGKSLEISYKTDSGYVLFEVIEPRYKHPNTNAISIPKEAADANGLVQLRITATKRHDVSGIAIVEGSVLDKNNLETLPLVSAYHHRTKKNVTDIVQNETNKTYVHTLPGDVIDLEFASTKSDDSESEYFITVGGVYAPLEVDDHLAIDNNWFYTLDSEAQSFLQEVYSLNKV